MATLTLTAQDVNGDPFISGSNINIVNGSTTELIFTDFDFQLFDPQAGETVSIDGGVTQLTYEFLGYGDVRADVLQPAAFIRVDMGDGTFQTFAIDMNADGDQQPTLATGNTKLVVANLNTTDSERFPAPACFTPGTLIRTPDGPRAVEALRAGDLVETVDDGAQPLRAVIGATFAAIGPCAPVCFAPGAIGNDAPLVVSPQHRVLIRGWQAELFYGQSEVLVAAKHLVNGTTVTQTPGGMVRYLHLLFDRHQLVWGQGVPSESFYHAGELTGSETHLRALLVGQVTGAGAQGALPGLVRPVLRRHEAAVIAA